MILYLNEKNNEMRQLIFFLLICISFVSEAQTHRVAKPVVIGDFRTEEISESGNLAWFYPTITPREAKQFEKIELGIKLPKQVIDKISEFLTAKRPNPGGLNPFNRNDIDIEASFYFEGNLVKRNEGFYYEEFRRDLGNNRWLKDTTSFPFRIRHSPEFAGKYTVDVSINIKGLPMMYVSSEFTVVESESKGFLEQGINGKHLRYSKTKESFVGVGQVIPWVVYDDWYHTDVAAGPVNFMVMYSSFSKLHQSGGNFTRMVAAPWFMQLEWEALGNYQPKMGQAWEYDRMNEKLEELDIYFIFCALLHTPLESHPPGANALTPGISWEAYCYNESDITPAKVASYNDVKCSQPADFYDSPEALNHQKNYFRYFVARYGYSTSLAGWQLMSESDQTCAYRDEKTADGTVIDNSANRAKVNDWSGKMTHYMRSECDDTHLKSTSFITGINYSSHLWDPTIFEDKEMSFFGLHDYIFESSLGLQNIRNRNLIKRYESVTNLNVGLIDGEIRYPLLQKNMFIYDEFGHVPSTDRAIPEDMNDDAVVGFNDCADFSFKQDLWFTFASGCAVAGLDWWNEHSSNRHKMWKRYFPGLNTFVSDIDFEGVNYTKVREAKGEIYIAQRWPLRKKDAERSSGNSYKKWDKLEAYIQIDSLGNQGFGWMLNRSFHWANLIDSMPCISALARGEEPYFKPYIFNANDDDEVDTPITILEEDAYIRVYEVNPRTEYTIDYYDTETGELILTRQVKSSFGGVLKIDSPEMIPSIRYDAAFKFYASDLGWK